MIHCHRQTRFDHEARREGRRYTRRGYCPGCHHWIEKDYWERKEEKVSKANKVKRVELVKVVRIPLVNGHNVNLGEVLEIRPWMGNCVALKVEGQGGKDTEMFFSRALAMDTAKAMLAITGEEGS
jgi:hypothetical protein